MLLDDVEFCGVHTSRRIFAARQMQLSKTEKSAAAYRSWLKSLPDQTGRSLTAIAKEIGVAASTLTRPLKPTDPGISTPHLRTVNKIIERYNLPAPSFIEAPPQRSRGFSDEAAPYVAAASGSVASAVDGMIGGNPNADPWVIKSRALELAGILPGDVVVVDLSRHPERGDIVCAQVNLDFQRGSAETVMRIYERAGASHVLLSSSIDPGLRAPIAVDDRVAIKGVVIGVLRPMARMS